MTTKSPVSKLHHEFYSPEILSDSKKRLLWIKGLSKQDSHLVVNDNEPPVELMEDLGKFLPAKYRYSTQRKEINEVLVCPIGS